MLPEELVDVPNPVRLIIDLDAFAHNIHVFKSLAEGSMLGCVVKCNAYGLGGVELSKEALADGADMLIVASTIEGIALRLLGIEAPILLLQPLNMASSTEREVKLIVKYGLTPTVGEEDSAELLSKEASRNGREVGVHIQVDTGMGRDGYNIVNSSLYQTALEEVKNVHRLKNMRIEGIYTHFASADRRSSGDIEFTKQQITLFNKFYSSLRKEGVDIPVRHAANSAACVLYPESHYEMVRPGIGLYCRFMDALPDGVELKDIVKVEALLGQKRRVPTGTTVSYERTFVTMKESTLSTIPIGYYDGINRLLSNIWSASYRGRRVKSAGRVCMNSLVLDMADAKFENGDPITLIGSGVSVLDVARMLGTIPYEVLCNLDKGRCEKIYMKNGRVVSKKPPRIVVDAIIEAKGLL